MYHVTYISWLFTCDPVPIAVINHEWGPIHGIIGFLFHVHRNPLAAITIDENFSFEAFSSQIDQTHVFTISLAVYSIVCVQPRHRCSQQIFHPPAFCFVILPWQQLQLPWVKIIIFFRYVQAKVG